MESKVRLDSLADVKYIDPNEARFYIENDNFLCLEYQGETYKNLKLHKAMPYTFPDDYISVQDMDSKEIFFIRSLYAFSQEQAKILANELSKRYFCPKILSIPSVKNKMGYLYFEVKTDSGDKTFAVRDVTHNLRRINDGARLLIVDVDGNRYQIDDVAKMAAADFKKLEPYLL
ncbi:MAG: DUF1854 domain-containing protein [Clostridia bacterium]|nr:DUF1854 domain-containing protein [Clostridia bacterium]